MLQTSVPKTKQTQASAPARSKPEEVFQQEQQAGPEVNVMHHFGRMPVWGNGTGAVVQPKLTINQPNDPFEQEADHMAEQVMRMPETNSSNNPASLRSNQVIQRKCATCGGELEEEQEDTGETLIRKAIPHTIQRKCAACEATNDEENHTLMRKAAGIGGYEASPSLSNQLNRTKGGGAPLPESTRSVMENAFQTDFSRVRIHTDTQAAEMSRGIQARAFTHGQNIYFNRGEFAPGSGEGKRLLAHELAHTIQQSTTVIKRDVAAGQETATQPSRFIVSDNETPGPEQMTKSQFLAQVNDTVCTTVDQGLTDTPYSSDNCPYIRRIFSRHADSSPQQIEQLAIRYEPQAAAAQSASELIQLIQIRVAAAVKRWKQRGNLADVPEDIASLMADGMGGQPESPASENAAPAIQFKANEGGAHASQSPLSMMHDLGKGRTLDSTSQSRMGNAFGTNFSNVEIHTDSHAASMASNMNAKAFTVGNHIAFGSGEYQPGTLVGDALLAHELAHVVQQSNAVEEDYNGAHEKNLETDANNQALSAVSLLHGFGKKAKNFKKSIRSPLRIQRCTPDGRYGRSPNAEDEKQLREFSLAIILLNAKKEDIINTLEDRYDNNSVITGSQDIVIKLSNELAKANDKNRIGELTYEKQRLENYIEFYRSKIEGEIVSEIDRIDELIKSIDEEQKQYLAALNIAIGNEKIVWHSSMIGSGWIPHSLSEMQYSVESEPAWQKGFRDAEKFYILRKQGDSFQKALVKVLALNAGEIVGLTQLTEAIRGQEWITDRNLSTAERLTKGIVGVISIVTLAKIGGPRLAEWTKSVRGSKVAFFQPAGFGWGQMVVVAGESGTLLALTQAEIATLVAAGHLNLAMSSTGPRGKSGKTTVPTSVKGLKNATYGPPRGGGGKPADKAYAKKVTGQDDAVYVDGVEFDGFDLKNSVLQDAKRTKGKGSWYDISKKDSFTESFKKKSILEQARRQEQALKGSGAKKIEWHISDGEIADQISKFFKQEGIGIIVKHTPPT